MKICFISDTHTHHDELQLERSDILIHSGDVSYRGTEAEIVSFLDWFDKQLATYKVFIAGNHDFGFEDNPEYCAKLMKGKDFVYLNDSGVTLMGKYIYGSPVQPRFHDWAFNKDSNIQDHWDLIPAKTDILVTHGPPHMIMDKCKMGGNYAGCPRLLEKIKEVKPEVHCFGHIHEGYGVERRTYEGNPPTCTTFVNASICGFPNYQKFNKPIYMEIQ